MLIWNGTTGGWTANVESKDIFDLLGCYFLGALEIGLS
jgi:hypothetical protein